MDILFPHDNLRKIQTELVNDINYAIANKKHIIAHAPTGLGKTAASLAPAITYAIQNDLTVFFLTSRHTQHVIAIDTLKAIKKKHGVELIALDLIGKKWMCPIPGVDRLSSFEFSEYCKIQREDGKCEYYVNTKESGQKLTVKAKDMLKTLKFLNPLHTEDMVFQCNEKKLCPYEMTTSLGAKAHVVVADYNYIFNSSIRDTFLSKTEKELEKCIVIVDEGHNLPMRVRDMMTHNLNSMTLKNAISEALKYQYKETAQILTILMDILKEYESESSGNEKLVSKNDFMQKVARINEYQEVIKDLEFIAEEVREKQKRSFIGSIAQFLVKWEGEDEGFARIFSKTFTKKGPALSLSYRCLDPSIITEPVIKMTHSTILMSGTLTPTEMYKDVLGFPKDTMLKEYESPFPKKNKLNLIVPKTTTKFTARSEGQFKEIAKVTSDIVNSVPGNTAVFFPSYHLRDEVNKYFTFMAKKTTLLEEARFSKEEKLQMLEKFDDYKKVGAVLLGVYSGSFGEGVDFPGDLLKAVIVVGLPLNKPDLETNQLIRYYDNLFGKGWDYGYLFPAMNKCFQSAGRCIRSETDRGVIVFLDERFTWPNYFRCFPKEWDIKISKEYEKEVLGFFS